MFVSQGKLQDVTMTHTSYCCSYLSQTGGIQEAVELELTFSVFIVVICRQPLDCGAIKVQNFPALGTFCALK
jgi:hypothetical protein